MSRAVSTAGHRACQMFTVALPLRKLSLQEYMGPLSVGPGCTLLSPTESGYAIVYRIQFNTMHSNYCTILYNNRYTRLTAWSRASVSREMIKTLHTISII